VAVDRAVLLPSELVLRQANQVDMKKDEQFSDAHATA